jgi:beta-phosphoglucomutase
MIIKAYIFDLDGVIVDTAHYHFLAWKRLADELSIPFTLEDNERLKGVSRLQSLDILLSLDNRILPDVEKQLLAEKKNQWFVEYINKMMPADIAPGAKELILQLKADGKRIALASSSKNARTVLHQLAIHDLFEAIVDGTMVTRTKPDPEIFLLAAKFLNVSPSHCVVVEDAAAGVDAALSAGMHCIGIGSVDQLHKAGKIFTSINDLKNELVQHDIVG